MNDQPLFSETQRSSRVRPLLLLLLPHVVVLALLYRQVVLGQPWTTRPVSNPQLFLLEAFLLALTVFFLITRLETQVRPDGIYVRYVPYHRSFRRYGWDTLAQAFIRQYNAPSEYKGWGARRGLMGIGRSLTVSGFWGLQLVFNDGEKLLIGTQQPEQLQETLRQLGQLKI